MKFAAIQSALAALYESGAFGLQTFWPSVEYSPSAGQPHARVSFISNQPEPSSIGDGGLDAHTGVMQIDLLYPVGNGTGYAVDMADRIAAVFRGGVQSQHDGQAVHIRTCGMRQPFDDGGRLRVTLSISWIAYVARG